MVVTPEIRMGHLQPRSNSRSGYIPLARYTFGGDEDLPGTMLDPSHPIVKLLKKDRRYKFDAYVFVFEALAYAHDVLGMGSEQASEEEGEPKEPAEEKPGKGGEKSGPERHLTGQQLCEAIRLYALDQYGYLAK